MIRIKINKIKEFLRKFLRILGEEAFLFFLVLIFLALILGGLLFYKYSFLVEKAKPEVLEKPLQFEEKTHQEVLKILKELQKKFEETELKKYPDPFRID